MELNTGVSESIPPGVVILQSAIGSTAVSNGSRKSVVAIIDSQPDGTLSYLLRPGESLHTWNVGRVRFLTEGMAWGSALAPDWW